MFNSRYRSTQGFISGFFSIFNAAQFIRTNHGFKRYFIIPVCINIVLLIAILFGAYYFLEPKLTSLLIGDSWYMGLFRYVAGPLVFLVTAVLTVFLFIIFSLIASAPVNDLISERVERLKGVSTEPGSFSIMGAFKDIIRITMNIVKLFLLIMLVQAFTFTLNFIPVVGNIVYSAINFMAASFFVGFQFFDFPLDRRSLGFKQKLSRAWKNKSMVTGLGMSVFISSFIPVFNIFLSTLGAVGATLLYCDFIHKK